MIVGGGVIGLSIAYRLAQEGVNATLIERGGSRSGGVLGGGGDDPGEYGAVEDEPEPGFEVLERDALSGLVGGASGGDGD